VLAEAVQVSGSIVAYAQLVAAFSSITIGTTLIDGWGRKPMMCLCFVSQVIEGSINIIIVFTGLNISQAQPLFFAAVTVAGLFNTMAASGAVMAVDGSVPDSQDRLFRLMCFTMMRGGATIVAQLANIVVLSFQVEDYSAIWPIYVPVVFCEMMAAFFLLIETKPKDLDGEHKGGVCAACAKTGDSIRTAFEIVLTDTKLLVGTICGAVGAAGLGAVGILFPVWAASVLGLSQAESAAFGAAGQVGSVIGSLLSLPIAGRIGSIPTYTLSVCLVIIACGLVSTANFPAYVVGATIASPMGLGMQGPVAQLVLSSRVAAENLGKFFSANGLLTLLMSAATVFVISNYWIAIDTTGKTDEEIQKELFRRIQLAFWGCMILQAFCVSCVICSWGWNYQGAAAESGGKEGAYPTYKLTKTGSRLIDEDTIHKKRTASLLNLEEKSAPNIML